MLTGKCSKQYLYLVLFLGIFIAGMNVSTLFPVMIITSETLGASANQVQLAFPAFLVSFAFAQLFYGAASDRYGRRIPYLIGLIFFLAGSLICFFTSNIAQLILGRFIQGAGIGCTPVLAVAILYDIHQRSLTKTYAYLMITLVLGFLVAPAVTILFSSDSALQIIFLGFAIIASILIVLALFFLPEGCVL